MSNLYERASVPAPQSRTTHRKGGHGGPPVQAIVNSNPTLNHTLDTLPQSHLLDNPRHLRCLLLGLGIGRLGLLQLCLLATLLHLSHHLRMARPHHALLFRLAVCFRAEVGTALAFRLVLFDLERML